MISNNDIWVIPFEQRRLTPQTINYLNQIEREKAESFFHQRDRKNYQLSHIYLREILSHYTPTIHPKEWEFKHNSFGKPYISNQNIHFNISHTTSYFAMIISNKECGIDIEQSGHIEINRAILDLTLTPKEAQQLKEKNLSFYTFWTLKEAYLKAIGRGLSTPPNSIEFLSIKENSIFRKANNLYKTKQIRPNLYLSCTI